MQMLSRRCSTDREVEQVCAEYDCIVCGSDQTWNLDPNIRYETPLYYMNFQRSNDVLRMQLPLDHG